MPATLSFLHARNRRPKNRHPKHLRLKASSFRPELLTLFVSNAVEKSAFLLRLCSRETPLPVPPNPGQTTRVPHPSRLVQWVGCIHSPAAPGSSNRPPQRRI